MEDTITDTTLSMTMDNTNTMTDSFYTGSLQIKDGDLDDNEFEDLQKEMKFGNIFIRILVFIIVLIVIAILVYFADKYFNLGLFV